MMVDLSVLRAQQNAIARTMGEIHGVQATRGLRNGLEARYAAIGRAIVAAGGSYKSRRRIQQP